MTNVYKNRTIVTDDEKVRIPDSSTDHRAPKNKEVKHSVEAGEDSDTPRIIEEVRVKPKSEQAPRKEEARAFPNKEENYKIYKKELEELSRTVAEKAYWDAHNQAKAEIRNSISNVQKTMDEIMRAHNDFIQEYTNELKYMALEIGEKMINDKIREDDMILKRLVIQSVNSVKNSEWINVEISERLVSLVDFMQKELEKPEYKGRAYVFPVAGTDDICRVTSEDGTIVSTISVQASNLNKAFRETEQRVAL